jgi:hypothetical protein
LSDLQWVQIESQFFSHNNLCHEPMTVSAAPTVWSKGVIQIIPVRGADREQSVKEHFDIIRMPL